MSLLPPTLLQALARRKLLLRQAVASGGVGERRSKAKGAGIEFAEHRPYHLGDDIRYLDQHVYARLGEYHVRQFSLYQQLQVTILLDTSASMTFGKPSKAEFTQKLAAALGYVALAGGDNVRIGAFAADEITWSASYQGLKRAPELFYWLENLAFAKRSDFNKTVKLVMSKLKTQSLLIIISDYLAFDLETSLKLLKLKQQDLIAIQVLAPEELRPEKLAAGEVRLIDSETEAELEVSLDSEALRAYEAELKAWQQGLKDLIQAQSGRFLTTVSDSPLENLLLKQWRTARVIS
ncbi:MAG: DUF58 domain-containing protein [Deinococcales bacterium]